MRSQWTAWLAEMAAAGKGGSAVKLKPISRGLAYSEVLNFNIDFSADAFAAHLKLRPDADLAVLDDFTVDVGSYSGGFTPVTISLSSSEVNALSVDDDDGDGLAEVIVNILHTPDGGTQYRMIGTNLVIAE